MVQRCLLTNHYFIKCPPHSVRSFPLTKYLLLVMYYLLLAACPNIARSIIPAAVHSGVSTAPRTPQDTSKPSVSMTACGPGSRVAIAACSLLPTACYRLPATCYLIRNACCLLFAVCCLLSAACCLIPDTCDLLSAICYLPFATC